MLQETRAEIKYDANIQEALAVLKKQGFSEFKADIPDFESPARLKGKSGMYEFAPDITAHKNGLKGYFEISAKTPEVELLVTKWKVLASLARVKDGWFKIFVPRGQMRFTKEVVDKYNIEADIIKL